MKFINEIKKFWEENTINNKVSGMKLKNSQIIIQIF